MSNKDNVLEVRGRIDEVLPGAKFRVILENGHSITAHLSGKMRVNNIRLGVGDEVKTELTPYDLTKGRVTYRF
ncbi:MAG: translation initiation factor IF-1 [Patescibacteria group bacterium]